MSAISVTKYFPCAKADFASSQGSHRLWTEYNITNIFNALLDVPVGTPVISSDGTKLLIAGYLFEGSFIENNNYYISVTNGELDYTSGSVLYDSSTGLTGTVYGGSAQKLKFVQQSICDIDLNEL